MKQLLALITVGLACFSFSQQVFVPIESFYKDQLFANKLDKPYNQGAFLPVAASAYDLIPAINDSTKQYYDATEILFKKYLFELKGEDFTLNITPAVDFSTGRDLSDTLNPKLFQNTRGVHAEGTLLRNFSFSTSFYENQGRYSSYQTSYYRSRGELYPQGSTYKAQNAVIPGAARTKDFKTDGFDYAYAMGYLCFKPLKFVEIRAGNNHQFIGEGHRSLLLSDNTVPVPYYRIDVTPSNKIRFTYMRARMMNLLRRPYTSSAESYYEAKGYSINYLTYMPADWLNISLFDGGMWNRGDSLIGKASNPWIYNPVPLISALVLKGKGEVAALTGINFGIQVSENHRVYGQLGMYGLNSELLAFQIGYRGYRYFGLNDLMLQLEINHVPASFYLSTNPRLSYTNFNLPVGHIKGDGLTELLVRFTYEWKRAYVNQELSYMILDNFDSRTSLPYYVSENRSDFNVVYSSSEMGYRFNRKINLCLYGSLVIRQQNDQDKLLNSIVQVGLRTGLVNHYSDF